MPSAMRFSRLDGLLVAVLDCGGETGVADRQIIDGDVHARHDECLRRAGNGRGITSRKMGVDFAAGLFDGTSDGNLGVHVLANKVRDELGTPQILDIGATCICHGRNPLKMLPQPDCCGSLVAPLGRRIK